MNKQLLMTFDDDNSLVDADEVRSFYRWCIGHNRQDLLNEWDYEKNAPLTPKDVKPSAHTKVWWIVHYDDPSTGKHFDFSWDATIAHRVGGRGCPFLSVPAKKVYPGFNDLATTHPHLAAEWAEEENAAQGLRITEVSKGCKANAYWKCKIHGLYQTVIADRCQGNGCPYCSGKRIKVGMNDLATTHPDLAAEWDTEKNGVGPTSVTFGSEKKVWWKCKLGHSWQASPNNRTSQHTGCPFCSGRRALPGFNDLATKNPSIAKEWDYERNGDLKPTDVTPGSNRVVWWRCPAGHEYKARIFNRTFYGTGCPKCNAERKTSFPEKAVFHYIKQVFKDTKENIGFPWLGRMELDIYIPSISTAIEYDGYSWHRNREHDKKKDTLCSEHGVRLIRIREDLCPDYESTAIQIKYGQGSGIKTLGEAIANLVSLLSPAAALDIDIGRDYSLILERYISNVKENSLAFARPDIADEWDYEKNRGVTPERVSVSSNRKVWWKCPKCGSSYRMMVNARTGSKHSNCPVCAKKIIVKGINDFASEHPELLPEWDFERNEISPDAIPSGSHKKVFWKCPNGHSYEAVVYSRTSGKTGCPLCHHQKTDGTNSFGILFPNLLEEWDYNRNEVDPFSILPGSNKPFYWKCKKCGYAFKQRLVARTKDHKGCPLCAHQVLVPGINDLSTQFPEVAKEWNYEKNTLKPTEVSGGTNKKYWWRCRKCGYEWESVVACRTKRGYGCPRCRAKSKTKK